MHETDENTDEHPILKLTREELLEQALLALKAYKEENADIIEAHPFKKFPYDISDMLDLIFSGTYRPLNGLFPSSHYITHVGTCIKGVESRLALLNRVKPVMEQAIAELAAEFTLSAEEIKSLKAECVTGMDVMTVPECLALTGLKILVDKETMAQSTTNSTLGIGLIKKALTIASTLSEETYVPKRYALLLAEIYSNSRENILDSVPYDGEVALNYLRQAKEHGSVTAAGFLEQEDPVLALRQDKGVEPRKTATPSADSLRAFGVFQSSESSDSSSSSSDDESDPKPTNVRWV